jgi:lysophospholipase L1-like esterase
MEARRIPLFISNFDMTRLGAKFVGWTLFALCFFGTVEVACRIEQWYLYDAPVLGMYTYDTALFTTDEYGITGKANGIYEKWRLNSFGFRGPEVGLQRPQGRLRIVCMGASETFGLYESREHEWPRQLERRLEMEDFSVEVINAAIAGMSLSQRTVHLQRRLMRLQPDVVVMMLEYGSYAGMTPEKVRNQRSRRPALPGRDGVMERIKALRAPIKLKESAVPRLPLFMQKKLSEWEKAVKLEVRRKDAGERFRSYQHVTPFEVETFRQDLAALNEVTKLAGIRLVILSPAMWLTDENLSSMYLSWPYVDEGWWREARAQMGEAAEKFAEKEQIPYLDLSQIVNGHEEDWMLDMLHFNDAGATQVAQHVARVIPNRGFEAVAIR